MTRVRQSELSAGTGVFLLGGATISALNATLVRATPDFRPDLVALTIGCVVAGLVAFALGQRLTQAASGACILAAMLGMLPSLFLAPTIVRGINMSMLFLPFFMFLVWFLPMWFARAVGYPWIAVCAAVMVARFGEPIVTVLLTIAITGIGLGELLGRFKRRLEHTSITDPLCDVWNRRGFERLLRKAIAAADRAGQPLALLYFDLDDFKAVNDQLGHAEGDRVLQRFARAVQDQARVQDVFARFGGDEFALLLIDSDEPAARRAAARLAREVIDPEWSYGVAERRPGESSEEFISRADQELLSAKQQRRDARLRGGSAAHSEPRLGQDARRARRR